MSKMPFKKGQHASPKTEFKKGRYYGPRGYAWTKEEDKIVEQYYATEGCQFVQELLPKRTRWAIIGHAGILKVTCRNLQPNNLKAIDDISLGRIAAYLDGEGCIYFKERTKKRGTNITIMVANTYLPMLRWIQSTTGCGDIFGDGIPKKPRHKPCYSWRLCRTRSCYKLAQLLLPYCIIKKDKLIQLIKFCQATYKFN